MPQLNLKLSKNEKRLLFALLLVLLVAGYYFYIYEPRLAEIETLEVDKADKQVEYDNLLAKAARKPQLEAELKEYTKQIKKLAPKFYGELSQEEFILIVNDLTVEAELEVDGYNYSDGKMTFGEFLEDKTKVEDSKAMFEELGLNELFLADPVYTQTAEFNFKGDYKKLRNYLMKLNDYQKHWTIDPISIIADEDSDDITGTLGLTTFNVPSLDEHIDGYYTDKYFRTASTEAAKRAVYDNIFEPYEFYKEMQAKAKRASAKAPYRQPSRPTKAPVPAYVKTPVIPSTTINQAGTNTAGGTNAGTGNNNIDKEVIQAFTNFNSQSSYFVPNAPEISGSVSKSAESKDGEAIRLQYTFDDFNKLNQASVVFEEQSIMQNSSASRLRMSVKYVLPSNNLLKASLVGADGKRYEIDFTVGQGQDWQHAYATIPADIKYPFMLRRIYVQSVDKQQKLEGNVLFDQLGTVK